MKDLLIVTADSMNMMHVFHEALASDPDLTFDCIDNQTIRTSFRYKSFVQRAYNFLLKSLAGRNLKLDYYNALLEKSIRNLESDYKNILIIRPDLLFDRHLQMLREHTDCFTAYYWDTVDVIPRKKNIVHYFDRIFSFDPADCIKYGFEFQPNFYYYENQPSETRYQIYNFSTLDSRRKIIEEIAVAMDGVGLSYLLKGFNKRPFKSEYIQYSPRVSYHHMLEEARYCDVMLDVARPGQSGLTFRPFEAMGLNKKLITTNARIKEYEFYDPENILIVKPGNVRLEKDFFEAPFKNIPRSVKEKYHIKQWLANVIGNNVIPGFESF
jgi:hypothetical protein